MLSGISVAQLVFLGFFCLLMIVLGVVVLNIARFGKDEAREERRKRR